MTSNLFASAVSHSFGAQANKLLLTTSTRRAKSPPSNSPSAVFLVARRRRSNASVKITNPNLNPISNVNFVSFVLYVFSCNMRICRERLSTKSVGSASALSRCTAILFIVAKSVTEILSENIHEKKRNN